MVGPDSRLGHKNTGVSKSKMRDSDHNQIMVNLQRKQRNFNNFLNIQIPSFSSLLSLYRRLPDIVIFLTNCNENNQRDVHMHKTETVL